MPKNQRESSRGYHFINTYQCCPRKWYIKYYLGFDPTKTAKALIFGKVFHEIMEAFYRGGPNALNLDDIISLGTTRLREQEINYETSSDFANDLARLPMMLGAWYGKYGSTDFELYEIIDIETELPVNLPNGMSMTVRPDIVIRRRETNLVYAFEHKTTSYSLSQMASSVEAQDQATIQQIGIQQNYPADIGDFFSGIVPSIVYQRASVCTPERTTPIYRDKYTCSCMLRAWSGLFMELTQKVLTLDSQNMDPHVLFPRNGMVCSLFGCEYSAICRQKLNKNVIPVSFKQSDWLDKTDIIKPSNLLI